MLKVDGSGVTIKGSKLDVGAELTLLLHNVIQEMEIFTREDIDFFVDTACKPKEELHKEAKEAMTQLFEILSSGL